MRAACHSRGGAVEGAVLAVHSTAPPLTPAPKLNSGARCPVCAAMVTPGRARRLPHAALHALAAAQERGAPGRETGVNASWASDSSAGIEVGYLARPAHHCVWQ